MKELLFGAAYYDEYMPYDRLDKDIEMMKKSGINTVRIAESTWSTCEPKEGMFDFSHVERVIRKLMELSAHRKCVIGFQIDNETKYYGTAGKRQPSGES